MPDLDSYTVDEWCRRRRVCRATFYNLRKKGRGPKVMKIGTRTLISREADDEYRRALEAEDSAGGAT
jgi:hypothetical protein